MTIIIPTIIIIIYKIIKFTVVIVSQIVFLLCLYQLFYYNFFSQIESAYHLYKATKDDYYLEFGKKFLYNLQNNSRVNCGYASIADVSTGRLGKINENKKIKTWLR